MPQYRYAHNELGTVIDAFDLPEERAKIQGAFTCLGCGKKLTPKTRHIKKVKHFAHAVKVDCNEETYLHRLAKQVFYEVYSQCLVDKQPFIIELVRQKICSRFRSLSGQTCTLGKAVKRYDLTRYYDDVRLEYRDASFIPDVILRSTTDATKKLYVEIAVTHFSSEEKRQSDNRIIEIPIEAEQDIERIKRKILTETDAEFINFDRTPLDVSDTECTCASRKHYCLVIYKSGKSILLHDTILNLETQTKQLEDQIQYKRFRGVWQKESPEMANATYFGLLLQAAREGVSVRNCFFCRYRGKKFNQSITPVYCNIYKRRCESSNEATTCKYFRRPVVDPQSNTTAPTISTLQNPPPIKIRVQSKPTVSIVAIGSVPPSPSVESLAPPPGTGKILAQCKHCHEMTDDWLICYHHDEEMPICECRKCLEAKQH